MLMNQILNNQDNFIKILMIFYWLQVPKSLYDEIMMKLEQKEKRIGELESDVVSKILN